FYYHLDAHPPALNSFPTRRSSDLISAEARRPTDEPHHLRIKPHRYRGDGCRGGRRLLPGGVRPGADARGRGQRLLAVGPAPVPGDRKSTRLNSSHQIISYAVFCLK